MPQRLTRRPLLALVVVLAPAVLAAAVLAARVSAAVPRPTTHALPAALRHARPSGAHVVHHAVRIPLGARAVRIARRYLGTPYRYGGESPSGFDCSGLVAYVYARLGVALHHNAAAQYGRGRPVALRHLRPGDLVFFDGLGHVGIAVGHGRYIHAPQTGRTVEIDALGRRAGSIVGARRVAG